jgi:hypothetical protein
LGKQHHRQQRYGQAHHGLSRSPIDRFEVRIS